MLAHSQNSTTFADYEWTYDAADRLTGFTNSQYFAENVTYSYDDRDQLTGADYASLSDKTYTYDENGNRTSGGFTPGTNNQLTTDGTYNYTYDDEGNLIKRTKISDGSYTDYEWDHRNRLVSVTDKTSGGTQTQEVTYGYDAFNRLVERTYQTTSGGAVTTGYFIYDGIQMILQLDDNADVEHRLLWGPAIDQALADETGAADVYWYLTDHLGTVRDVVEYNDGTNTTTLANHIVFDSFGRRTSETNSSLGAFDIGYTGKWFDRNTGLAWHWNRWYNPAIGRWMSEDPIGFETGDANKYRYVRNQVSTRVDQNGLEEAKGYWERVGDVFRGYGDAAVATGQGAFFVARHPFQAARGLKDSLERTIADPIGTFNAVCDHVSDKASTLRGQGELVGDIGIGVLTGGASRAASRSRVFASFSGKADNVRVGPSGELPILNRQFTPKPTTQGRVGEVLVGLGSNKTRITIHGRNRIPDGLDFVGGTLSEVKNVRQLSCTRQIRDLADYARQNDLVFELYVPTNTARYGLSGPLRDAIRKGDIVLKLIPEL